MIDMNYQDFLFEIGTEELPPLKIQGLAEALEAGILQGLKTQNLSYASSKIYATPRRLAVLIKNLIIKQPDNLLKLKGPSVHIAFDQDGKPSLAAQKFAQTCQVNIDQLERISDNKGEFLFCQVKQIGKNTQELLPEIITSSLKKLPINRPMRWGSNEATFVRPAHWILMLFGKQIIDAQILGIKTANQTFGHRFHYNQAITINQPDQYEELLATQGFVIADIAKRKANIVSQVNALIQDNKALLDETLLSEIADLVEWPVALLGNFEEKFLQVPQEALITVMQKQQRYIPIVNTQNKLLSEFIIISNIASKNPEQVITGNQRVIRARLTDAEFFYNTDAKSSLISYAEKLKKVAFQEQLGSLYDKTLRLEHLSGFIANRINADTEATKKAALLSKCDLMTSMVWEFPELQGIMGDYYARSAESGAVANAIREHYLPRFANDTLPTTDIACALAIADRMDNLVGMFGIGKIPSGEKDPFGLRRAANGIIHIILEKKLTLNLRELIDQAYLNYAEALKADNETVITAVLNFIYERLRHIYSEQGKSANVFRDVLACNPEDLLDFTLRFDAVTEFSKLEQTADLIEIYKRIKNILNKANIDNLTNLELQPALLVDPAEQALANIINEQSAKIYQLHQNKNYLEILLLLTQAKPILSEFFANVMVMVDDEKIKTNRLVLLNKLKQLFNLVADFNS